MKFIKKWDLEIFIGLEGHLFRTKTGELTLRVDSFEVLSKKCFVRFQKNSMD